MKYILAVSGGVDSVVLLDMMSRTKHTLVVAHVDHGIRSDSAADARFVAALAKQYKVPFVSMRFELGENASEDQARSARYGFLNEQAKKYGAAIMTAHHEGDVVETIAINLTRGTGWKGLAVMAGDIERPLIHLSKMWIIEYAVKHRLEWVEDSTNNSTKYLRNRLRRKINQLVDENARDQIFDLRAGQIVLRTAIERELDYLLTNATSRHFLSQIDSSVAEELLARLISHEAGQSPTRPMRHRALIAAKTARPGTVHHVMRGVELHFTSRNLSVKVV